jgi:hypothetical protein
MSSVHFILTVIALTVGTVAASAIAVAIVDAIVRMVSVKVRR